MKMPIQPIINGRFVKNRMVEFLLDNGGFDMNDLAIMEFTDQERMQFAQLIGYSVSGFGSLSYVDNETCEAANQIDDDPETKESEVRLNVLRQQINEIKKGLRLAASAAFDIILMI